MQLKSQITCLTSVCVFRVSFFSVTSHVDQSQNVTDIHAGNVIGLELITAQRFFTVIQGL